MPQPPNGSHVQYWLSETRPRVAEVVDAPAPGLLSLVVTLDTWKDMLEDLAAACDMGNVLVEHGHVSETPYTGADDIPYRPVRLHVAGASEASLTEGPRTGRWSRLSALGV